MVVWCLLIHRGSALQFRTAACWVKLIIHRVVLTCGKDSLFWFDFSTASKSWYLLYSTFVLLIYLFWLTAFWTLFSTHRSQIIRSILSSRSTRVGFRSHSTSPVVLIHHHNQGLTLNPFANKHVEKQAHCRKSWKKMQSYWGNLTWWEQLAWG